MTPLMAPGSSTSCAWLVSWFGPEAMIWRRKSTLNVTGSDTPEGVVTRNSRAPSGASGATVTRTRNFFSSLSAGTIPPRLVSRLKVRVGAGAFVALKPPSPLKMKPSTWERFSPSRVTVELAPRCTQSGETEVILGRGWEWAKTEWSNATRKTDRRKNSTAGAPFLCTMSEPRFAEALHEQTHPRPLPRGEPAFLRAVSVPLPGGVRGGFRVPRHDIKVVGAFHEPARLSNPS